MKAILFIILFSFNCTINAQQKDSLIVKERKNNVSLSFLGETVCLTLNYQRYLFNTKNIHLSAEVGMGVTFMNYTNLTIPVILSAEFGRKHRICAELAMANIIDFTPYPKTKAERDSVQKIPYSKYSESNVNFWDTYQQPYNYTLAVNVGYKFIAKKGFNIKLTGGFFRHQSSPFQRVNVVFVPKIAVGYAF